MRIKDVLDYLDDIKIDYLFDGDENVIITGFSSLSNYKPGSITWIKKFESLDDICNPSSISVAIIQKDIEAEIINAIRVDNSKEVFFKVLNKFWGVKKERGVIGQNTVISEDAKLHPSVTVGVNCSIVGNIDIGANSIIENNVIIQGNVKIGERCYIQSGTVIGIDGYGFSQDPITKKKTMIEHFGGVEIGDDVFIGAHVNIARGTIDNTIIKSGTKIAPSTHIGHNNCVGEDVAVICSNLYGSVVVGNRAYITASTVANQTTIGEDTVIGMGSVVTKPIEKNVVAFGIPAIKKRTNDSGL